jgi:hypothetical protein
MSQNVSGYWPKTCRYASDAITSSIAPHELKPVQGLVSNLQISEIIVVTGKHMAVGSARISQACAQPFTLVRQANSR